jgi:arylsulfatase A-like enzyme
MSMGTTPEDNVWGILFRGVWTGVLYGVSYFIAENVCSLVLIKLAGVTALYALRWELALQLPQYGLFGGAVGIALSPLVTLLEPRLPRFLSGPRFNLLLLAIVFIAVSCLWNPESFVPRYAYVLLALGALVGILVIASVGRFTRFAGSPPLLRPIARMHPVARGFILAGLGLVFGAVAYFALRSPSIGPRATLSIGSEAERANIVLIVLDALRQDHLACYGYGRKTAPIIERIAEEGAVFERAYTTASWTLPAHASLFTGLYTSTHETDKGSLRLSAERRTLAEILSENGYRTAGFSANPWLSSISGLEQGFERFEYLGTHTTQTLFLNLVKERARALITSDAQRDLGADNVITHLLRWVEKVRHGDAPFFVFANFMEVHAPYGTVPEPYFSSFLQHSVPKDIGRKWVREKPLFACRQCQGPLEGFEAGPTGSPECVDGKWRLPAARLEATHALYDAGILYVDYHIGRIYRALERAGILDETLLIITSDHGDSLGEHGSMGHGLLLYEQVLKVPLVMRYPRIYPPRLRVSEAVSLVDVLPTIEHILGLPRSPLRDAVSLVPGDELAERPERILAEYFPPEEHVWKAIGGTLHCDYSYAGRTSASLRKGSFKYIWSSDGQNELYNLESDPAEEENLIGGLAGEAQMLDAELHAWRANLRPEHSSAETYGMDSATKETLKSLGYIH